MIFYYNMCVLSYTSFLISLTKHEYNTIIASCQVLLQLTQRFRNKKKLFSDVVLLLRVIFVLREDRCSSFELI